MGPRVNTPLRPVLGHDGSLPQGDAKHDAVEGMFDRLAPRYDRMNRIMSLGMDGRWRAAAVRASGVATGDAALDVCCGTGDLAIELRRAVGPSGRVVGLDFSPRMLDVARAKSPAVEWLQGDALDLPFGDGAFAAATVAWGVRNLADREGGFREPPPDAFGSPPGEAPMWVTVGSGPDRGRSVANGCVGRRPAAVGAARSGPAAGT